jgi:hypothetical protein
MVRHDVACITVSLALTETFEVLESQLDLAKGGEKGLRVLTAGVSFVYCVQGMASQAN